MTETSDGSRNPAVQQAARASVSSSLIVLPGPPPQLPVVASRVPPTAPRLGAPPSRGFCGSAEEVGGLCFCPSSPASVYSSRRPVSGRRLSLHILLPPFRRPLFTRRNLISIAAYFEINPLANRSTTDEKPKADINQSGGRCSTSLIVVYLDHGSRVGDRQRCRLPRTDRECDRQNRPGETTLDLASGEIYPLSRLFPSQPARASGHPPPPPSSPGRKPSPISAERTTSSPANWKRRARRGLKTLSSPSGKPRKLPYYLPPPRGKPHEITCTIFISRESFLESSVVEFQIPIPEDELDYYSKIEGN